MCAPNYDEVVKLYEDIMANRLALSDVTLEESLNLSVKYGEHAGLSLAMMLAGTPDGLSKLTQDRGTNMLPLICLIKESTLFTKIGTGSSVASLLAENTSLFMNAYHNNNFKICKALFAIPEVRARALRYACHTGDTGMFKALWAIEDMQRAAAAQNNQAFINACLRGNIEIFNALWAIEEVRRAAAAQNNLAFINACCHGHIGIVNALLEIEDVRRAAAAQNNLAIKYAIRNNRLDIFNILLINPDVLAHIADHNNDVLQEARWHGTREMVDRLLQIPAVLALQANPRPVIYSQVDTHTASVHASVSRSAKKLIAAYGAKSVDPKMYDVSEYLNTEKNMQDIFDSILQLKPDAINGKELTQDEKIAHIKKAIHAGLKYAMENDNFKDPTSDITIARLLQLLLIGINELSDVNIKTNAYVQLCAQLYLLQTEYKQEARSCPGGFFNALVYSQQSTLPNEINVIIQSLSNAAAALQNKMKRFASGVLKQGSISSAEELKQAILTHKKLGKVCGKIIRSIVKEYPEVFECEAVASNNDLKQACLKLTGHDAVEKLFEVLEIDYDDVYNLSFAKLTKLKLYIPRG